MRVPQSYKVVFFIAAAIFGSHFLHTRLQLSIAPFDIILSLVSIYAIIIIFEFLYENFKLKPSITTHCYSFKVGAYIILATLFALIVSYWLIESAIQNPFGHSNTSDTCFTHGYSQFLMGIAAFLMACLLMFELIFVGDRKKKLADSNKRHDAK